MKKRPRKCLLFAMHRVLSIVLQWYRYFVSLGRRTTLTETMVRFLMNHIFPLDLTFMPDTEPPRTDTVEVLSMDELYTSDLSFAALGGYLVDHSVITPEAWRFLWNLGSYVDSKPEPNRRPIDYILDTAAAFCLWEQKRIITPAHQEYATEAFKPRTK